MKVKTIHNVPLQTLLICIVILALLLFDKGFSKLPIVEPIYLHDVLLLVAVLFSLNNTKLKISFTPLFVYAVLSVVYLIYSITTFDQPKPYFVMIFRQYFLFFYLICSYILSNNYFVDEERVSFAIKFILFIAKGAVILQLGYFVFLFATVDNYSPFKQYSYFSSITVMGITTYAAYALTYLENNKRIIHTVLAIVISLFLGHASSFFSVFAVILLHFFISVTVRQRTIFLAIAITFTSTLFLFPQYTDVNATWRLLYWGHVLKRSAVDNFLIFGNGFGQPYMTNDFALYLARDMNSVGMYYHKMERWLSPPHNSFLTMIFHLGLLPFTLFLMPLKKMWIQMFALPKTEDKKFLFLMYAFVGCSIWSCFNVILELPHSALFFWLVYFTFLYYAKHKKA